MPDHKKKLLFYIGTLGGGGAERVLLELLKHLDRNKYMLAIVMNRMDGVLVSEIPPDVKIIDRSETYKSYRYYLKRIWGLAEIIKKEKADLVISFLTGANRSLMRCRFLVDRRIKFILREGNNPGHINKSAQSLKEKFLSEREVKLLYPKADRIVTTSFGIMKDFTDNWGMDRDGFRVIHNMIDIQKMDKVYENKNVNEKNKKTIIAVGRLFKQKGYGDMIRVFSKVIKQVSSKLIILGDGPERDNIERMIKELSLENDISMPGFVKNPWEYMKASDVYLSTSHYEGFHLTITEAMACGLPVVATDCDYGPGEIIDDGVDGHLCPVGDIDCIAEKVVKILKNKTESDRISTNAKDKVKKFDVSVIVRKYESLFDQVLSK